jgi:hypothetical protein
MTTQTVTPTETPVEPTGCRATSAELRRIADALDTLPPGDEPPYTTVSFLPAPTGASPEEKIAAVDAVALAVLGKPGELAQYGSDSWFHIVRRTTNNVHLTVQESVPAPKARDAELDRLRARIAELEATTDRPAAGLPVLSAVLPSATHDLGFGYSREVEPDDPTPVSPDRAPAHIGDVVGLVDDGQLVTDETPIEPIGPFTRYFSFGGGHHDPRTGEPLRDKYVTVIASTVEGCREAMLARYGRDWSFEYVPGYPSTEQWIPRWTEHERLDVTAPMPAEAAPGDCTCWATSPNGCPQHAVSESR